MKDTKALNRFSAVILAGALVSTLSVSVFANEVTVDVNIPVINGPENYRPYVAVWIENEKGKTIKTLSVWRKESDWLKDMRRWWRKAGRYDQGELDAVTSATRPAGLHAVTWDGTDQKGNSVAPGKYIINVEAAREHGSRSWVKETIILAEPGKSSAQSYTTKPADELGSINITVK